jgi:2-iminoacetate synthase ThiH
LGGEPAFREKIPPGGTGILLQGGVQPTLPMRFHENLVGHIRTVFPHLHIHAFSAPEIWYLAKLEKLPLRRVLERLIAAGLDSIPGGGADDLGSIMLEENAVAATGTRHRMSQGDMERIIRGAGFNPRQRRTLYEPL